MFCFWRDILTPWHELQAEVTMQAQNVLLNLGRFIKRLHGLDYPLYWLVQDDGFLATVVGHHVSDKP